MTRLLRDAFCFDVKTLPDDVVINILSRLPADSVLQCRIACKGWRELTKTSYFINLQHQIISMNPRILVKTEENSDKSFCPTYLVSMNEATKTLEADQRITCRTLVDPWISNKLILYPRAEIACSCDGLVVISLGRWNFERYLLHIANDLLICNPVTGHNRILTTPGCQRYYVCGFFFHDATKEYRLLCVFYRSNVVERCFRYLIWSSAAETRKPWRQLTSFSLEAPSSCTPVILNGYLHWLVSSNTMILRFNTNTEEFDTKAHPSRQDSFLDQIQLVDMEGLLGLCEVRSECCGVMDIWVLRDYIKWDNTRSSWIRTYRVKLDRDINNLGFVRSHDKIEVISIKNGEVTLYWFNRGWFKYNLRGGHVRKFESKILIDEHNFTILKYSRTLVSF